MTQHITLAAGIDTGKRALDIALSTGGAGLKVDNDPAGHDRLADWLARAGVVRVGIEASGGYERAVVDHLRGAGFELVRLQPAQVRAYAGFRLQRAKNDRIDAALIAQCAAAATEIRPAPDPRLDDLAEDLTRLEQLDEDIPRAKTRLEAFRAASTRAAVQADIKRLNAERRAQRRRLADMIAAHPDLAQRLALIESVPGIGQRTAIAILIRLPEIEDLSREQAAALAGLAPFDRDSGARHGNRAIAGGRARLRRALYAASLPAAYQWNPALVSLYRRLRDAGKPHKLALIAVARKLLIFAITVVQRGTPWTSKKQAI